MDFFERDKGAGQVHSDIAITGGSPHSAFAEIRSNPGEVLKTTIKLNATGGDIVTGENISQSTISAAFDGEHPDSFQLWGFMQNSTTLPTENINLVQKSPYLKIIIKKRT